MRAAIFFRTHPVSMLKMRPQGISDKSAFLAGDLGQRLAPDVPDGYSGQLDGFPPALEVFRIKKTVKQPGSLDIHRRQIQRILVGKSR